MIVLIIWAKIDFTAYEDWYSVCEEFFSKNVNIRRTTYFNKKSTVNDVVEKNNCNGDQERNVPILLIRSLYCRKAINYSK